MLGNIHASIGDPDDVFDREAVHREAGDAKAAANVVLGKHGVSDDPEAKALGKNLRLLDAGFGHEDDELVSAIPGHHIRLTAFLLEQAPNTAQHQIAFKMAKWFVHLLAFVEINEHDGEGASRAGSALPFGGQGFPEEAAGLDTGEAVGDGLLLQLLKDE